MPKWAKIRRESDRCKHGHPWTNETTYWYCGYRNCKVCRNKYQKDYLKRYREKIREQKAKKKEKDRLKKEQENQKIV